MAVAESDRSVGEVINIGTNTEISIGDCIRIISEVMGQEIEIFSDQNRIRPPKSEVNRLRADNSKALELLNWSPVYIGKEGFRNGISETVKWFADSDNLKDYKVDVYNI